MDDHYIIVSDYILEDLVKKVNTLIKKGYKPKGGIAISEDTGYFYQAMYREF